MRIMRAARGAATLLLLLGVAACAQRPGAAAPPEGTTPPPRADLPSDTGSLVLRVEHVGGFTTPEAQVARLPIVSVYADGRAFLQGPVPAIYPGAAWPNVQVLELGRDGVQALADRASAAGVTETGDLGTPPLADVPSTRFTLVTSDARYVREVYGLTETADMPDSGLTDEQVAARQRLYELFGELGDLAVAQAPGDVPQPWTPVAVAAVVRPWTAAEEDMAQGPDPEPLPWPGPALPGEQLGAGISCVVATGEQATAVIEAARNANALTPWSTPDGARWAVSFRPLLPDESTCADLTG
jgi:hypothetical protein